MDNTTVIIAHFQALVFGAFVGHALPRPPSDPVLHDLWLATVACVLALLLVAAAMLCFSDPGRRLLAMDAHGARGAQPA